MFGQTTFGGGGGGGNDDSFVSQAQKSIIKLQTMKI